MDAKQLLAEVREGGLTQIEVAAGMGVSQSTVSKIERGQTVDLKTSTYQKLLALHRKVVSQPSIVANGAALDIQGGLHA